MLKKALPLAVLVMVEIVAGLEAQWG